MPTSLRLRLGCCAVVLAALGAGGPAAGQADGGPAGPLASARLEAGFRAPPAASKPWCYWYWISDRITKEGLTRDLEAMARIGIGEAFIGNIFLDDIPAGPVKVLSEAWWGLVEHALREGARTGVDLGLFNSPGWSQSGGPWVQPHQAMRYLVSSETRVRGPVKFGQKLPVPKEPFQDVAVLAFPAPAGDADSLARHAPRWKCMPAVAGAEHLVDGRLDTALRFPAGAGQGTNVCVIACEVDRPLTARALTLTPSDTPWAATCVLLAADGSEGAFRPVKQFRFDRSNMAIGVGPMPHGPVTVSFAPVTAARFRLEFTGVSGTVALAELELTSAARVEAFVEKQLGKMHPTPLPQWDTYLWPASPEPDSPAFAVPPEAVRDLSALLEPDGTLRWDAPPGDWVLVRMGMTPTGTRNAPASPEGVGLEVDKMNRAAARAHFDAFMGEVLRRLPAAERTAFRHVVADSYEMGSQNWTDGFGATFRARYGYDPVPWLPVLTGRVVGGANASDRFLWDLRRLVADRVAEDYVGGLRDLCRPHGLELWLENYGHWGFPAEFLQYGGQSDRIGGEFWVTGDLGSIELRAASSCANTYGKPIVSAEAFTGGPPFQTAPWGLKARGDWAFCEGVNHFVLHVYIHQPSEDRVPGMNAWFGTEFNRHNTWFAAGRAWIDYLRRCSFLLQQGVRVADVAYFIGEDTPKMTGVRQPPLPAGCDFDYLNAEVLLGPLRVADGWLTLPHGTRYRVLVLPELATVRPEVLRKIRELVRAGATVLGPPTPPVQSPSLERYPACDDEVRQLAADLWGTGPIPREGERRLGQGRLVWGRSLETLFAEAALAPDFQADPPLRFTHRQSGATHLYFVANPEARDVAATATFRVTGLAPEFWWPDTGRWERAPVHAASGGTTRVPVRLGPHGSVFVVFREAVGTTPHLVRVARDGPAAPGRALDLASAADGSLQAVVWEVGTFEFTFADGTRRALTVDAVPEPIALTGPWEVRFSPGGGAPERVVFDTLMSWTAHPDSGVKFHSGTATYRATFRVNPSSGVPLPPRVLDLGQVRDLATVRLNGQDLGTLWHPPWQLDLTRAVRPGENVLELDVVNPWNNRLVGDAALPAAQRRTHLAAPTVKPDAPLLPAGLLGPVTIRTGVASAVLPDLDPP